MSRAWRIDGESMVRLGTSEVIHNMLTERVLGFPWNDDGPRDEPWRDRRH